MTPEQVVTVVEKYELELKKVVSALRISPETKDPLDAPALAHALWMCEQTKAYATTNMEKASRWLGFIQGVLWTKGVFSISDMKDDNR